MNAPFDPDRLTPSASLNRVRILDLPGIALETWVKGRSAYELLSAQALAAYLQEHADSLGLDPAEPARLPILLDRCFDAESRAVRAAAEEAARHLGRRLGYLILTLRRGDAVNRLAREDWDDTYWAHWASICQIWLGGGLVSGQLGPRLRQYAEAFLIEAGMADCALRLARYPAALPLVGAACSVPPTSQAGLVFDFGHSFIKRGYAWYQSGMLAGLHLLTPLPMQETENTQGPGFAEHMAAVMADTWQEVRPLDRALAPVLVASVASYIVDGHPAAYDRGVYAQLRATTDHLGRWLSQAVSGRVGQPVEIELVHDGTAAAWAYAGAAHAAVIMLGTALGVGFPPRTQARRLSPAFQVSGPGPWPKT